MSYDFPHVSRSSHLIGTLSAQINEFDLVPGSVSESVISSVTFLLSSHILRIENRSVT